MTNGATSVEESYSSKHTLVMWSNNLTYWYWVNTNELKTYTYGNFLNHCQTWKQTTHLSVEWKKYLISQSIICYRLGTLNSRNLFYNNSLAAFDHQGTNQCNFWSVNLLSEFLNSCVLAVASGHCSLGKQSLRSLPMTSLLQWIKAPLKLSQLSLSASLKSLLSNIISNIRDMKC